MKKEEFKQELVKNLIQMKNTQKKIQNYVEIFNEEFDTKAKIRTEHYPILNTMATEYLEQRYKATAVYEFLAEKIRELEEDFRVLLDPYQKEMLEKMEFVYNEMMLDMAEQGFVYGFIMSQQLQQETEQIN